MNKKWLLFVAICLIVLVLCDAGDKGQKKKKSKKEKEKEKKKNSIAPTATQAAVGAKLTKEEKGGGKKKKHKREIPKENLDYEYKKAMGSEKPGIDVPLHNFHRRAIVKAMVEDDPIRMMIGAHALAMAG